MSTIQIDKKKIGENQPTYFIADIAANHDGDLERAKDLIYLCAQSGADAAKFQHFTAQTIVSDYGFKALGRQKSHQANWKKSVFDVYQDASLNMNWTPILKEVCDKAGIAFFTSPYSIGLVDEVEPHVSAFKVGSGDITWLKIIDYMATKNKPILLATGASSIEEVCLAMDTTLAHTKDVVLMQCNTNYTGTLENFKYINLNVLTCYKERYPNVILGLSDHTPGHSTVLGAVALGARVIEKHFTDDNNRIGPDHAFSLAPKDWREMVQRTRELEQALGAPIKKVEDNEKETVVLQRRSIRLRHPLQAGSKLNENDLEVLRPCPTSALPPYRWDDVIGKMIKRDMVAGEHICWNDLK